ncbi:MAG: hypothetical protein H0W25_15610 [Acidimicrobiia bacterium]|nr:hypothetical protein [Acidimicrobiia bacterium]
MTGAPTGDEIEAVVFDYGGVLSLAPFDSLLEVEVELGLPPGTLRDDLQHGVALADAELGTRSAAECFLEWLAAVQAAHGITIEPGRCSRPWPGARSPTSTPSTSSTDSPVGTGWPC